MSAPKTAIPVIKDPEAMSAWAAEARARGERIAFVPTMGYLHEGHLSLLREGRQRGEKLVISIFVNPTQFGPKEDLSRYPRDLAGDLLKAASCGTDVAFVPEPEAMYPHGYQSYVQVRDVEQGLCGGSRPGHFIGVATVVLKLFNIVRPHLALFGEKDFQQLAVIRTMARDLNVPVDVMGFPTIREADGLAMSSRNSYLSPRDRQRAQALSRGLKEAKTRFQAGERQAEKLVAVANTVIAADVDRIDYIEIRDAETLGPVTVIGARQAVILVAAYVGSTRLIDNLRL